MKLLGGIILFLTLPILIIIAVIEPTFIGEGLLFKILSLLGVGSFSGWLLNQFK